MAHEIVFDTDRNINPIAFVGETPWHGLGQQLTPGQPIEVWAKEAGMDWTIETAPLYFDVNSMGTRKSMPTRTYPGRQALLRSDTQEALSIVGNDYQVVHPPQILDFFRDLTETAGLELNTAGVLFGGKKFWALAKLNQSVNILGQDRVDGYLLLATSCDGSLATTAMPTSVRVVCNNTLQMSGIAHTKNAVRVFHSQSFDEVRVKQELGLLNAGWGLFAANLEKIARVKLGMDEAREFFLNVLKKENQRVRVCPGCGAHQHVSAVVCTECQAGCALAQIIEIKENSRTVDTLMNLYSGGGIGSDLAGSTLWGAVNAVTEWTDHIRGRSADNRLNNAWFGQTAVMKNHAMSLAMLKAA